MDRTHQIMLLFVLSFITSSYSQDCGEALNCVGCYQIPDCGWCAATLECLSGNSTGPYEGKCIGAWEFGGCEPCSSFHDCITCSQHQQDCFWCEETNDCFEIGTADCESVSDYCPCSVYKECSLCIDDPLCHWCEGNGGSCTEANNTCTQDSPAFNSTTGCPCSSNYDCEGCSLDLGCQWCNTTNTCIPFGSNATCPPLPNCQAYCNQATTCDSCLQTHPGCEWCSSDNKCYDSSTITNVTACKPVDYCPDCTAHYYCDTCLDNGCQWCADTLTCGPQGTACNTVTVTCVDYCLRETSCQSCNNEIGCGWCGSAQICVDIDTAQTCVIDEDCSSVIPDHNASASCGFDAGAFIGGMFLVIGLLIIALAGYFFYVYKFGKKSSYSQL